MPAACTPHRNKCALSAACCNCCKKGCCAFPGMGQNCDHLNKGVVKLCTTRRTCAAHGHGTRAVIGKSSVHPVVHHALHVRQLCRNGVDAPRHQHSENDERMPEREGRHPALRSDATAFRSRKRQVMPLASPPCAPHPSYFRSPLQPLGIRGWKSSLLNVEMGGACREPAATPPSPRSPGHTPSHLPPLEHLHQNPENTRNNVTDTVTWVLMPTEFCSGPSPRPHAWMFALVRKIQVGPREHDEHHVTRAHHPFSS